MKIIKKKLCNLGDVSENLVEQLKNRILSNVLFLVLAISISVLFWNIYVVTALFLTVCCSWILFLYEYYLITRDKLLILSGICNEIVTGENFFNNKNKYLIIYSNNNAYKVLLNKKRKIRVGSNVDVYTIQKNIYRDEEFIHITNPLYIIVKKQLE